MSQAKVSVASALNNRVITFIDIDNDFDCVICLQIADDPVRCSLSCCGVFCNYCMSKVARKTTCPSCNNSSITACRDTVLRNQILKHQVYCPNKGADDATSTSSTQRKRKASSDERCTWIGRYDELGTHLNVCECEAVPCTNDGCQEKIERRELEAHELACVHRKVECDHCDFAFEIFYICFIPERSLDTNNTNNAISTNTETNKNLLFLDFEWGRIHE